MDFGNSLESKKQSMGLEKKGRISNGCLPAIFFPTWTYSTSSCEQKHLIHGTVSLNPNQIDATRSKDLQGLGTISIWLGQRGIIILML